MYTRSVRDTAIALRRDGFTYTYIADQLHISKSTLSGWLADVPFAPNQATIESIGSAKAKAAEKRVSMRQNEFLQIEKEVELEIGEVTDRDLFMFGLGLYLGEGSKTNSTIRIVNADPKVIQISVAWFLSLGLTIEHFLLTLHLYPDSDIEKCLHFWSTTTTIPICQFGKVQIDTRDNKKAVNTGKLPYGTAHLGVRSLGKKEFGVVFSRKIQSWTEEVIRKRSGISLMVEQ